MLEAIFSNPVSVPATARGAMYRQAPKRQVSPLEAFLKAQTFGKQQAGNTTPTYHQLGPAPAVQHQTLAPEKGAAPAYDPAAIQDFYSDPANADYHSDPALLGIRAADNTTRGNADVAALRARRQLVTQLGDRGLAEKVLGPGDETLGAISADPDQSTSILARLARSYRDTTSQNEDALNKGNLFYSSERGRVLNQGAQDYATQQADAIANAQAELDSIGSQLSSVKGSADQSDAAAEQDAFNRYMQAVAAHPPTAPGGSSGGGSGGSTATVLAPDGSYQQVPSTPETDAIAADMTGGGAPAPYSDQQAAQDAAQAVLGIQTAEMGGSFFAPVAPYSDQLAAQQAGQDYLAQFLEPKKPLSGYASGSGSGLH